MGFDTIGRDLLPEALVTGSLAALLRWFRPRRLLVFLASVTEAETYRAMMEHEQASGAWWMAEAHEAQAECTRLAALLRETRADLAACRNECSESGGPGY